MVRVTDVEIGTVFPQEIFVGGEVDVYWSVYLDRDVSVTTPVSVVLAINSKDNVIYDKEVFVEKGHHFTHGVFKVKFSRAGKFKVMVGAKVIQVGGGGGGAPPRTPIRMFSVFAYEGYVWSKPVEVVVKAGVERRSPPSKPREGIPAHPQPIHEPSKPKQPIRHVEPAPKPISHPTQPPPKTVQPIYKPIKKEKRKPEIVSVNIVSIEPYPIKVKQEEHVTFKVVLSDFTYKSEDVEVLVSLNSKDKVVGKAKMTIPVGRKVVEGSIPIVFNYAGDYEVYVGVRQGDKVVWSPPKGVMVVDIEGKGTIPSPKHKPTPQPKPHQPTPVVKPKKPTERVVQTTRLNMKDVAIIGASTAAIVIGAYLIMKKR